MVWLVLLPFLVSGNPASASRTNPRPLLCTEYLARPAGSTFDPNLNLMNQAAVSSSSCLTSVMRRRVLAAVSPTALTIYRMKGSQSPLAVTALRRL